MRVRRILALCASACIIKKKIYFLLQVHIARDLAIYVLQTNRAPDDGATRLAHIHHVSRDAKELDLGVAPKHYYIPILIIIEFSEGENISSIKESFVTAR